MEQRPFFIPTGFSFWLRANAQTFIIFAGQEGLLGFLEFLGDRETEKKTKQCRKNSAMRREPLAMFPQTRHVNIYAGRSTVASKLS